ncbi:MAG TPA: hypothetical protein ENJ77_01330 [Candidatus Moranbacteria bacterium]|nr:hypothetical protein [Candidatus Moranbacteria bacterium]
MFAKNDLFVIKDRQTIRKYRLEDDGGITYERDISLQTDRQTSPNSLFFIDNGKLYRLSVSGKNIGISAGDLSGREVALSNIYSKDLPFDPEVSVFKELPERFAYDCERKTFHILGQVYNGPNKPGGGFLFSDKVPEE